MFPPTLTLVPAYGRDYKSKAALLKDWKAGKDFRVEPQGCYINNTPESIALLKKDGYQNINFRYNKQRHVTVYTIR